MSILPWLLWMDAEERVQRLKRKPKAPATLDRTYRTRVLEPPAPPTRAEAIFALVMHILTYAVGILAVFLMTRGMYGV